MYFLLNILVQLPDSLTEEKRVEIVRREKEKAIELIQKGILRRIWRVVGQLANYSIWETKTPEELHQILQTLPMFPYANITIIPIIKHPVEIEYENENGSMPELKLD